MLGPQVDEDDDHLGDDVERRLRLLRQHDRGELPQLLLGPHRRQVLLGALRRELRLRVDAQHLHD